MNKWTAPEELGDSGRTPRLVTCGMVVQGQSMPCPDGRALVVLEVPGRNLQEILLDLKEDERVVIETQLARVLE